MSPVGVVPNAGRFAKVLDCDLVPLLILYLGLPLGAKFSFLDIWNLVIERMDRKLYCWKGKYLLKGDKLVLLKSTLASVPIYILSLFQAPKSVFKQVERI